MTFNRAALLFVIVAGLCPPAFAQSVRIDQGVEARKTFGFYWETRLEPETPAMDVGTISTVTTGSRTDPDIIFRLEGDRSRHVYFGYQAQVDVLAEPNTYRITFIRSIPAPRAG